MKQQFRTLAAAVMLTASALTAQNLTIGSTDSRLNLNLTGDQSKVGVALYDLAGRKLFEKSELLSAGTHGFDLPSSLARGMYIMQVEIDGKQFTRKFIAGSTTAFTITPNASKDSFKGPISSRSIGQPSAVSRHSEIASVSAPYPALVIPNIMPIGDINSDGIDDYALLMSAHELRLMKGNSDGSTSVVKTINYSSNNDGHEPSFFTDFTSQVGFSISANGQSLAYLGKVNGNTRIAVLIQKADVTKGNPVEPWTLDIDANGVVVGYQKTGILLAHEAKYNAQLSSSVSNGLIPFDANSDQVMDIAVTQYESKLVAGNYNNIGRLAIVTLSTNGTAISAVSAAGLVNGQNITSSFTRPLASAGDLNNDGYNDIICGSTIYYRNATRIWYGLPILQLLENEVTKDSERYPKGVMVAKLYDLFYSGAGLPVGRVHGLGDINSDGYTEFTLVPDANRLITGRDRYMYIYSLMPWSLTNEPSLKLVDSIDAGLGDMPSEVMSNFASNSGVFPVNEISASNIGDMCYSLTAVSKNTVAGVDTYKVWKSDFDRRTPEQKMLSFSAPELWTPEQQNVATMSYIAGGSTTDKSLKVKFTNGTWLGLQGVSPLSSMIGKNYQRIICKVKLAIPATRIDPKSQYRGNFQMHIGWGWVGQFEINDLDANGQSYATSPDGYKYLEYEFQVPDNIRDLLNTGEYTPRFVFSAARNGEEFIAEGVEFRDGGVETGLNPLKVKSTEELNLAISWENYLQNGDALNFNGVITHTVDGIEKYYILNQDVDYPMYLVQMWSKLPEYEPGGHTAKIGFNQLTAHWQCWRQCWTYIGDKI